MGKDRFGGPHAGRARVRQIELDRDSSTVDQQQAVEIEEWKAAIAIDPKEPEFQYGYARTLGRRHELSSQIEHDRLAAEADPGFGPASLDLGEALLSQKRIPEAMAAFQVAAKDPAVAADARFDLGQLHFQKGEYDAAVADLTVATGSAKKEVASHAWVLIARIASRQHKLEPGEAAICSLGQLDSEISTQTLSDPELRWLASKYDPRRCPAFGSPR
jgi:tetratricopeptide (TPR) repeat protein